MDAGHECCVWALTIFHRFCFFNAPSNIPAERGIARLSRCFLAVQFECYSPAPAEFANSPERVATRCAARFYNEGYRVGVSSLSKKSVNFFDTWELTLRHHACTALHDDVSPRAVGSLPTESPSRARERTYI